MWLENANKYWLKKELWKCVFCEKAKDNLEHYVGECEKIKIWFRELGYEDREILENYVGRILTVAKERYLGDYVGKEKKELRVRR